MTRAPRAVVVAVVTAVDLGVLWALAGGADLPVVMADAASVGLASVLSWFLHREVTYGGDLNIRWVRRPTAFALAAVIAGGVDVAVTTLGSRSWPLLAAKVVGIVAAGGVRIIAYRGVLGTDLRRHLGQRRDRPAAPGDVRVTVVVPAKDEAARIGETVRRLETELADLAPEVLVVDDGSDDGTAAAASAAGARVIGDRINRGKGAAVRTGMLAARGRTVAFLDADLAYPPSQVRVLVAAIEDGWDVAVGNRFDRDSVVEGRSVLRYLVGRIFNAVTAAVLLGQYRDTQCGCKAFRSDVARALFPRTRLDGFAFDVEVLHLVERDGLSLVEVPVTLRETGGSTVRIVRSSLEMLRDLLRVRRWSRRGEYDTQVNA
ncbi:MAG TPA: glycosyltransferase [Acidimicrobiales bacterium]|nr:glycosyltransferase [Acidimicrobiales bacterium]